MLRKHDILHKTKVNAYNDYCFIIREK